jgi:CHAT domain-containing protein
MDTITAPPRPTATRARWVAEGPRPSRFGRWRARLLPALLALATLAFPAGIAAGDPAGPAGVDRCLQQFAAHPEDRESARCFFLAGDRARAASALSELLRHDPDNPGLLLYTALLQPSARSEWQLRAAAGRFSGNDAAGELLARYNLTNLLLTEGRHAEAGFELERAAAAAPRVPAAVRAKYMAWVSVLRARLFYLAGDLRQAGRSLDEVPAGPLRDPTWLVLANTIHLETGQTERAWDECLQLSAPAQSHLFRAKGLYCQARVLISRIYELPSDTERTRIQQVARQAVSEAAAAGAAAKEIQVRARWTLMMLARNDAEAAAELPGCLAEAGEDLDKRLCLRALARRLAAAGRLPPPDVRQALDALALDDPVTRAQAFGDRMRVSWENRPFADFLQDARRALAGTEELRARQSAPEVRKGLFSTWSEDYYWFGGRLLETDLVHPCPVCIDSAFDAVERLRARGLAEDLAAGGGAAVTAGVGDPATPEEVAAARRRLAERRADRTLPRCENDHATLDLARLEAEETRLGREAAAAAKPSGLGDPAASASGAPPAAAIVQLTAVQTLLQRNEALLSFQIAPWTNWSGDFGGGSWLVVATRNSRRSYKLAEAGRGPLRDDVADFLQSQDEAYRRRLAARLYRQLLEPALAGLPAGVDRLVVVPDDDLHRLPLAALRTDAAADPLVMRYQIVVVPSATLWARWRSMPPPAPADRPALVLADPPAPSRAAQAAFRGEGIELPATALPGARGEARAVLRYLGWGSERRIGREVSAAALLQPPDRMRRFAVVHFATHSIVDERDPERSGIWLAPAPGFSGLLQVPAIARLRCDGRLVVLSTCSGNGGPLLHGEGVMSLARAFFQARARTVVASLWPVADDDAEALLRGFYRQLGRGASVAAALRQAQIERLRDVPSTPIAAWAGMIVLGDGSLVPFPGGRHPWTPVWLAAGAVALLAVVCFIAIRRRLRR